MDEQNQSWMTNRQSGPQESAQDAAAKIIQNVSLSDRGTGSQGFRMPGDLPIGIKDLHEATKTLNEYKQGKANLEQLIIDNEQWYKLRHWETMRRKSNGRKKNQVEPVSAWLFNAIQNKHADAMDNYPTVNIQPREEGDKAEAEKLSSIVPVILQNCDFEATYSEVQDYKIRNGTGVYGIFWDGSLMGGMGDISIKSIDLLNLFWQPGIKDIQKSRNLFYVELVDNDLLEDMYPELKGKVGGQSTTVSQYIYDDTVNTMDKTAVVEWYYKKWQNGRMILHYCKYVNDTVLFATENEPEYKDRGWYDHGMYPFEFDVLFRTPGTPCGFGLIDVAKSAQEYIDRGNQAILQNLLVNAKPRHFIRTDGGVNEQEYADLDKDFIHVEGSLGEDSIRPVYQSRMIHGTYVTIMNNKVDELKEVCGNRDISTGGTMSGLTAASAIAALQEAGSKLSRDSNKASYRVFRKVCLQVIELIRQFYDVPREFRILGDMAAQKFTMYDNSGIAPQAQGDEMGVDMGMRVPLFDLDISSEKNSPYSRMSANELALQFYQARFFDPQMADQALACMSMMDFDRKDQIMQMINQNGQAWRMAQQQMMMQRQHAMMGRPPQEPVREEQPAPPPPRDEKPKGGESSITRKARQRVANAADPG